MGVMHLPESHVIMHWNSALRPSVVVKLSLERQLLETTTDIYDPTAI